MDEPWFAPLSTGHSEDAWDAFIDQYRRLIFASIRHYVQDYDDVMDVFVHVCEALRDDDLRRLRSYADGAPHAARFSTWLVTVVRHLAVDWFRKRDGRRRLPAVAEDLPPLQRRIFQRVFMESLSHVEAYEAIRARDAPDLTFGQFLAELRDVYRAVTHGRRGMLLPGLVQSPVEVDGTMPRDEIEARERSALIETALTTLPAQDRVTVELYVMEGLPAEDVARIVGLPNAKAVYNRTYRALADLRAWMLDREVASDEL